MLLASEVARFREAFMKDPKAVNVADFKIPFEFKVVEAAGPARTMTRDEYCDAAMSLWRGMLGIPDAAKE